MKFCQLAILSLLICLSASSQVSYNVFIGPQASSASYNVQGVKQKTTFKTGVQAGVGLKVGFDNRLYFAPALFYSLKGYKVTYNRFAYPPDPTATDNNTSFHNVETAFLLQYDFSNNPSHWYFKTGPSLDFQFYGKEKFNTPSGAVSRNIPFGYDKYGHYSANFLFHLGYEMSNGFLVYAQYTHGLADINNADDGPKIRHRAFGISVGKFIGSRK